MSSGTVVDRVLRVCWSVKMTQWIQRRRLTASMITNRRRRSVTLTSILTLTYIVASTAAVIGDCRPASRNFNTSCLHCNSNWKNRTRLSSERGKQSAEQETGDGVAIIQYRCHISGVPWVTESIRRPTGGGDGAGWAPSKSATVVRSLDPNNDHLTDLQGCATTRIGVSEPRCPLLLLGVDGRSAITRRLSCVRD